jgi:hypothetical protein
MIYHIRRRLVVTAKSIIMQDANIQTYTPPRKNFEGSRNPAAFHKVLHFLFGQEPVRETMATLVKGLG